MKKITTLDFTKGRFVEPIDGPILDDIIDKAEDCITDIEDHLQTLRERQSVDGFFTGMTYERIYRLHQGLESQLDTLIPMAFYLDHLLSIKMIDEETYDFEQQRIYKVYLAHIDAKAHLSTLKDIKEGQEIPKSFTTPLGQGEAAMDNLENGHKSR